MKPTAVIEQQPRANKTILAGRYTRLERAQRLWYELRVAVWSW